MGREPLKLGMVGGGEGAFIGDVHRIAARIDDRFELVSGVFSSTPEKSRRSGRELGISEDRLYEDFEVMAKAEAARSDGIDVVAIVTPNHMHFGPAKTFLEAGIHVICDKPMTLNWHEAEALAVVAQTSGKQFMLTHNYTGYPMIREAKRLIADGDLGHLRIVNVEYIQGWLAAGNVGKQAAWRIDPKQAGIGGCLGDIGTHAFQLAEWVTKCRALELSANLQTFGDGRTLDDNADIRLRFENDVVGNIWASQVAIGQENGLRLRVIGTEGAIEWHQEQPNHLWLEKLDQPRQRLTRGGAGFRDQARIPAGHPEGFLEGFASLYRDFADVIQMGNQANDLPGIEDGLRGLRFIEQSVTSNQNMNAWLAL